MGTSVAGPSGENVLLVRTGGRLCGLPVEAVAETMRPLPVSPVAGTPAFVRGISIVRGEPVPVVDLAALLGGTVEFAPTRFIAVRAGPRRAALAVASVVGVARLDPDAARTMPLVRDACGGALESLRARDEDLLVVLGSARVVPEEASAALATWEARR
jgi:purine-binding chemotaxis protein CheW